MKTIVEVGAHTGEETIKFLQDIDAQVYAFEPDKDKFSSLYLLSRQFPRLTLLPFAVDAGDSQEPLFQGENGKSSLNNAQYYSAYAPVKYNMVWTIRLDTFFTLYGIQNIEYLRIDAPWNELMCLESLGDKASIVERGRIRSYDIDQYNELITWLYDHGFSTQQDTLSSDVEHPDIRFWRN